MQAQGRFRTATGARRASALLVIAVLLLSTLPAALATPASAQDGTPEVAEEPPAVHTYSARKAICPAGANLAEMTRESLFTECTQPLKDVAFTLAGDPALYPGDTRSTQIQEGGPAAFTSWSEIPVGMPYTVTETIPDGYGEPWVFCEFFLGALGNVPDNTSYAAAPAGRAEYVVTDPPYQNVLCTWFNVPLAGDAQATPGAIPARPQDDPADVDVGEIDPGETGRVIVYKRNCPAGYEIVEPVQLRTNADCALNGPTVIFALLYGTGTTLPLQANDDGIAVWEDIPAGTIQISEPAIEGWSTLGVYCASTPRGGQPDTLEDAWSPESGVAVYVLPENGMVTCEWFNLAAEGVVFAGPDDQQPDIGLGEGVAEQVGTGRVIVDQFYCPAGFELTLGPLHAYYDDCRVVGPTVSYTLVYGAGQSSTQQAVPVSDGAWQRAQWTDIPAGTIQVTKAPIEAYATLGVYCGTGPMAPSPPLAEDDSWAPGTDSAEYVLQEGYDVHCNWLSAPVEGGNIIISESLCPAEYDYAGASLADLRANCTTPREGVLIIVSYGPGGGTATETVADTEGGASAKFINFLPGTVTVSESDTPGYALARVFCDSYDFTQGTPVDLFEHREQTVTNNGFTTTLEAGVQIECYFFDVPLAAEAPPTDHEAGTVIINKQVCPPGLANTNPSGAMFPNYLCTQEPGVEFTVSREGVDLGSGTTDDTGRATIIGLTPGPLRIAELPREDHDPSRIFCVTWPAATGPSGNYAEIPVDNWGIPYELQDGYVIECEWKNMPAAAPSTDPATIILHKYTCPEGYSDENKAFEMLLDDCPGRTEGVNFRVEASGNVQDAATTASGDVQFTGVTPGNLTVEEISNQGYRPIRAYCDYYEAATGTGTDFLITGLYPGLSAYVTGGYTLECYWFNVPYIEPAEIEILKYVCPPDYGITGASREDILFNCTTPVDSILFQLLAEEGYLSYTPTDAAGRATITDIPAGPLVIFERAVTHQTLKVYCGDKGPDGIVPPNAWQELDISAESVEYQAQPGAEILCYWINGATEYPDIVVHKLACPDGYVPESREFDEVVGQCTGPMPGVSFTLTAGGVDTAVTTGNDGLATWSDVPDGDLTLMEVPPPDYPNAAVFCDQIALNGQEVQFGQVEVQEHSIQGNIQSFFYLECYWFNYAEPAGPPTPASPTAVEPTPTSGTGGTGGAGGTTGTGGTGGTGGQTGGTGDQTGGQPAGPTPAPDAPATLIITKFTCPGGFDLHDPDANPVEDCEELTDDIDFSLAPEEEQDDTQTAMTGQDEEGAAEFSDLDPGAYALTETLPEDTLSAFIYTCVSDQRAFQLENPFVPFAYAGPNGQIGVLLIAGETLECSWYNVPEPVTEVTVLKFQCPGLQVNIAACEPSTEPATFTFQPLDGSDDPASLTTDATGAGTANLPPGAYQLSEQSATACLIDSEAFDLDGNLILEEGQAIEVRIYNCGA